MYLKIKQLFEQQRNLEKAEQMSKYMRNQFVFYGLHTKDRRNSYNDFLTSEKKKKQIDWKLLNECWADEHREFQYFVADYLQKMLKELTFEDVDKIKLFVTTKQWWDTIDAFDGIIGNIQYPNKKIDDLMLKWSVADDF